MWQGVPKDHSDGEASDSPIWIRLLGNFGLFNRGQPVLLAPGTKSEALLTSLAVHYFDGLSREALLALLWPNQESTLATQSLNSLIYRLRHQLAPALQGAPPLVYTAGFYQLNAHARIEIDVVHFDTLVQRGNLHLHQGRCSEAMDAFRQAVALYLGDLSNADDIYAVLERERLRASYLTLLAQLGDYCFVQAHYANCLEYARRLLVSDPCREDAHRLIMRCYVHLGQRAQALHHYRFCVDILQTELNIAPEQATIALYDQIRHQPTTVLRS